MKPVLVLYTSDDCSGCRTFKPKWPGIKESVKDYVTEFAEFSQATRNASDWNNDCPSALRSSVTRFPSLFLVNATDYKRKDAEMRFVTFTGTDIVAWVKENANTPTLLSLTPPDKSTQLSPPQTPKAKALPYSIHDTSGPASCSRAYKLHKSDS